MILKAATVLRIAAMTFMAVAITACGSGSTGSASAPTTAGAAEPASASTPAVALSAPNYSVAQGTGSVTIQVNRMGTATDAVSVAYATNDGTAVAGTDYTATSGTLQWAENDATPKTITVPVSDSTPYSGAKTFQVVLDDPSDSVSLTNPGSAMVSISGADTAAAGTVQFATDAISTTQDAGTLTVTVTRTDGSSGAVSANYMTASGSATAGKDFTAATGTLQWDDGDAAAKTFTVPISQQAAFTGSKTFALSLTSTDATVGDQGTATVTIAGTLAASPGTFQLSKSSYSVAQGAGTLTVSVNRTGGSSGAASVSYKTSNGTAAAGTDFTASTGTLKWADGDTAAKSFTVAISNATPFSGNRTCTVALSNPSSLASITSPGSATVTIAGDAAAPTGTLTLAASSYTVAQNAGSVTISVSRTGGTSGAATVAYYTANGTAVSGTDFTTESGTLSWANGDSAAKTFSVPVSNATPFSGSRTFTVSVSGATGASLGTPASATVKINGDAATAVGSLQLSASTYTVAQSGGSLTVTVNRTGGSSGAVSVAYTTTNVSAVAGTDYTPVSGTLSWANADAAAKTFSVPISNAAAFSGSKTFKITIASPTGGATLSTPSSATATINGSGSSGSAPTGVTWMYLNCVQTLAGDFTGQGESTNYENSTSSGYNGDTKDILITSSVPWGYFIPYWASNYQLPNPGYTNLLFQIKPTITGDTFGIHAERDGDSPLPGIELAGYCGAFTAGQWTSCTVPLSSLGVAGDQTLYKVVIATHTATADSWEMDAIGFK
jgi:ribosomal protein L35AE/L33A